MVGREWTTPNSGRSNTMVAGTSFRVCPIFFRRNPHTSPHFQRYPVILDSAIQSNGLGFVGTDRSTFSILSMRRVQDWHDGATRLVKWGKKNADAHRKRMAMEYPE